MKTVLVTGGAGFIGSHIVDKLVSQNYKAIVLDNLVAGNRECVNPEAKFYKGDVTKEEDLEKVLSENKIDVVFHLAAQPSIVNSFKDPFTDVNTNLIGTMKTVIKSVNHGISRFIYASSMTVYGNPKNLPVDEECPAIPINYYGIAKYAAERFVHVTSEKKDLPQPFNVTSFRMFNVYGPRQSLTNPYQGVLAIFIGNVLRGEPIKIFGEGNQTRDFVYIDDVAKVWIDSIENKKSFGKVFNIAFGEGTPILSLAKNVIKACGFKEDDYPISFDRERSGDQKKMEANISKAKKYLNFQPEYALDSGLKKTLSWAIKNTR